MTQVVSPLSTIGATVSATAAAAVPGLEVLTPEGKLRGENSHGRVVFGPTCDSVDRLPGEISLPDNIQEGDYVVFHGAGAYSVVTNTRFNGFGERRQLTVMGFD